MHNTTAVPTPVTTITEAINWGVSPLCYSELARDIAGKGLRWPLSPRQQEVLVKIHLSFLTRKAEAQARAQAGIVAPEGRTSVSGVVTKVYGQESEFGFVTKVHVDLPCGARVRGNATKGRTPQVGDKVTFTATFSRSQHDASMAYWSRAKDWVVA